MATRTIEALPSTAIHPRFDQVLSIDNVSGELKSVGVTDGISYHYLRIVIDGTELVSEKLGATANGNFRTNCTLPVGLRFEHSVLVQGSSNVRASQTRYWAVAETDSSDPIGSETIWDTNGDIDVRYRRDLYQRPDGEQYSITVGLGPERISRIDLDRDLYLWDSEAVSGSVSLETIDGEPLYEEVVRLVLRVAGTQREFPIIPNGILGEVGGRSRFGIPSRSVTNSFRNRLERQIPGFLPPEPVFEIVCALDGYANYPSRFRLI